MSTDCCSGDAQRGKGKKLLTIILSVTVFYGNLLLPNSFFLLTISYPNKSVKLCVCVHGNQYLTLLTGGGRAQHKRPGDDDNKQIMRGTLKVSVHTGLTMTAECEPAESAVVHKCSCN